MSFSKESTDPLKTMSTKSMTGNRSRKKRASTSRPPLVTDAAHPTTKRTLRISAPIILPIAKSPWPLLVEAIAVTSSGRLVPKATKRRRDDSLRNMQPYGNFLDRRDQDLGRDE
jgi:hypothetical protein